MRKNSLYKTSANVDFVFFLEITRLSETYSVSKNHIFKDLIFLALENVHSEFIPGKLTDYQNHSAEKWVTFNYFLNSSEIEIFTDTRKKYKISISKLAFVGFILFWKILLFIYKERLKIEKDFVILNTYDDYSIKCRIFIEQTIRRLLIILKE